MNIHEFIVKLYHLDLFPMFVGYLLLSLCAPVWKKFTYSTTIIQPVLVVYSAACSLLSLYAAIGLLYGMISVDKIYVNSESPILIPYYRIYAFTKKLELMDTVFMMLRHKTNQISFLHVFHHSSMLLLVHYALEYSAWTALAPGLMLNALVHFFLYFYYGYSACYGSVPLFWKKKLTQIQLAQFVIGVVYAAVGYTYHRFCIWSMIYPVLMIVLFSDFYYKAYIRVRSPRPRQADGDVSNGAQMKQE